MIDYPDYSACCRSGLRRYPGKSQNSEGTEKQKQAEAHQTPRAGIGAEGLRQGGNERAGLCSLGGLRSAGLPVSAHLPEQLSDGPLQRKEEGAQSLHRQGECLDADPEAPILIGREATQGDSIPP